MTDAQTWTVVGVLAATLISAVTVISRLATQTMQHGMGRVSDQIAALDVRLGERIDALDERLSGRIDALDVRLGERIDALDRDVQAIANRAFGTGGAQGI